MKTSVFVALMATSGAYAFAPSSTSSTSPTQLGLFGGGNKSGGDGKPGMMDQLAMFKKAQEMAQKKQNLDKELSEQSFKGSGADGKVTVSCKFAPSKNPMDPQPDYQATGFDFDEEWWESASPEDIGAAVAEAYRDGIQVTNLAVQEKYKELEEDIKSLQG